VAGLGAAEVRAVPSGFVFAFNQSALGRLNERLKKCLKEGHNLVTWPSS